ncbi:hypothetical protein [Roseospira goensis]|uniref:Uncharacterized protein n=1 Tax=Roseospira goensis TaxID=391922 RepID=A0A7W6S099_9PROT|nr:hypothetical protein [Roseospira goensis]MBB4286504.1 hypothetical protein [Roseospira goensis]
MTRAAALDPLIAACRARLARLRADRSPTGGAAAAAGWAGVPQEAACFRDGLVWRTEELGRCACDCYGRGDTVAAVILTRGVIEDTAALWYLKALMRRTLDAGPVQDRDVVEAAFMALLVGRKDGPHGAPRGVNVLTMLRHLEKDRPDFGTLYDALCEIAHPSGAGTAGAYGGLVDDGGTSAEAGHLAETGLGFLLRALDLFEALHAEVTALLPALAALWAALPDRPAR